MFNVLNEKEMFGVNGGGYYVPVYVYDDKGYKCYRGTCWVASGSNIKCYVNGKPQYY